MSKAILVWGAPHSVANPTDYNDAYIKSGRNFGNILIGNAVRTVLAPNRLVSREEVPTPEHANERCSHIVIPAANFLWKDFDFGYMADYIEKTVLPVTIIGVGAQTNDRTTSSPIHPNTLWLMKIVAERSAYVGVRGFYTAEVLAANGIHNVQVIGCPSLYTNRVPTIRIDASRLQQIDKLAVNFSRRVNGHSFHLDRMKDLENRLMELALQSDSTFIAQDELEEIEMAETGAACPAAVSRYFDSVPVDKVSDFFRNRTRYFYDVDAWSTFMRTQSASIGTRFHGNLIALINGVPALMIVHDSRTMEMCTLIGIPSVHIGHVPVGSMDARQLRERLESASFDAFEKAYAVLYKRFARFLRANGLRHNLMRETDPPAA